MDLRELRPLLRELVLDLEKVVPFASAFAGTASGRKVQVSTYNKSAGFVSPAEGVTLSAFTGSHFVEMSTNRVDADSLRKLSHDLLAECERAGVNRKSEITIDPGEQLSADYRVEMAKDPNDLALSDMLQAAEECRDEIQKMSDKVVNAASVYSHNHNRELYINRHKDLYQEINRWDSVYFVVFSNGENNTEIFGGHSKQGGWEHMSHNEANRQRDISDGEILLTADRMNPGNYDCIFSPAVAGIFAHEAFGHGTETDMYLKKRAKGREYMNRQVASSMVSMFDSPAMSGESGSYFFDHEGMPAQKTQIIKDGILVSGMTDLNSATRLGYKRTPNGRRENYGHKVYARMTNTCFETGSDTFEDMIKSIQFGYFIDHSTNGMEDPKGWGIQLEALMAREIRDGKLTDRYHTPVIITGYVPDLLKSISMVGPEMEISGLGMCGKGHKEWVKVTDGGPYLKLKARLA